MGFVLVMEDRNGNLGLLNSLYFVKHTKSSVDSRAKEA